MTVTNRAPRRKKGTTFDPVADLANPRPRPAIRESRVALKTGPPTHCALCGSDDFTKRRGRYRAAGWTDVAAPGFRGVRGDPTVRFHFDCYDAYRGIPAGLDNLAGNA